MRYGVLIGACLSFTLGLSSACGAIPGGDFANVGNDVVSRFFHASGKLRSGEVMVTGGLGLQIFPPSLFSRNDISFYHPDLGTFSSSFLPLNGGAAVSPNLVTARSSHTQTTLLDGRVLICGGNVGATGTSPGAATSSVEIFDPYTGIVATIDPMNVPRAAHTAILLPDGRVIVAGGSSWQAFSPDSDSWSNPVAMMRSRTSHAAVLLTDFDGVDGDDRVLLIAGSGSGADSMELINPTSMTSTLLSPTLAVGVNDLAAIRLADGDVLIVAGQNVSTGDTISDVYRLDPVTPTLTPLDDVPNRPDGISDHEIARNGRYVIIFGGEQQVAGADTELNYAAIFDTDSDTWIADGTMNNVHDDFTSVPISACEVLLIDGGVPLLGQEAPSSAAEIFTLTIPDGCQLGDINNDGFVDTLDADDLSALLVDRPRNPDHILYADLNADGFEDGLDLAEFVVALLLN